MFVDIDDKKSPIGIEVILHPIKKGKEKITPDICQNILKSTNYARSIRDMLTLILELPKEEQAAYKEIILSTFDNREQPNDIILLGKKLAFLNNYENEFSNMACKVTGDYYLMSEADAQKYKVIERVNMFTRSQLTGQIYFTGEEFNFVEADLSKITKMRFIKSSEVSLIRCNLCGINMHFEEGTKVNFYQSYNFPQTLDVSLCEDAILSSANLKGIKELKINTPKPTPLYKEVNGKNVIVDYDTAKTNGSYLGVGNLPEILDLTKSHNIDMQDLNLASVKKIKLDEGTIITFAGAKNLPQDLDVSSCAEVSLRRCDLSYLKNLHFATGAKVELGDAVNIPKDLDVSQCSYIDFQNCDLSDVNDLHFAEGSKVWFLTAKNSFKNLDVSSCQFVYFGKHDLEQVKELKFRENAEVWFYQVDKFPEELDFSLCSKVKFNKCDISGIKLLRFRDKKQLEESMLQIPENWDGKIECENQDKTSILSLNKSSLSR